LLPKWVAEVEKKKKWFFFGRIKKPLFCFLPLPPSSFTERRRRRRRRKGKKKGTDHL
jgi:hypothetical protein